MASHELLEIVLRECAAAGGQPWYPSDYVKATGVDRGRLDDALDGLRMAGLVELTAWVQGKGQGYVLTDAGGEVARSPRLLQRVRAEGPAAVRARPAAERPEPPGDDFERRPASFDRARAVRDALLTPQAPTVTLTLVALNIAYFFVGMALCVQKGIPVSDYLGLNSLFVDSPRVAEEVYYPMGILRADFVIVDGQWWRILTSAFMHLGLLHLALNMYVLYSIGPLLEQMWGHGRYLIIYMVSAIGSGCAGIVLRPEAGMAGASGAICGLLGAMLGWVLLNRAYLPREVFSRWINSLVINIIIIGVISMNSRVSGEGHLGGGVAGLLAAVPLNFSRFGRGLARPLGLAAALLLPVLILGWAYAQMGPYRAAALEVVEANSARRTYLAPAYQAVLNARRADNKAVDILNELIHGDPVDPARKEQAADRIGAARRELRDEAARLQGRERYQDERVNQALAAAAELVRQTDALLELTQQGLTGDADALAEVSRKRPGLMRQIHDLDERLSESVLAAH